MSDLVTITTWHPEYRNSFISLNREWIERYFRLEACDYRLLGNPVQLVYGDEAITVFPLPPLLPLPQGTGRCRLSTRHKWHVLDNIHGQSNRGSSRS